MHTRKTSIKISEVYLWEENYNNKQTQCVDAFNLSRMLYNIITNRNRTSSLSLTQ